MADTGNNTTAPKRQLKETIESFGFKKHKVSISETDSKKDGTGENQEESVTKIENKTDSKDLSNNGATEKPKEASNETSKEKSKQEPIQESKLEPKKETKIDGRSTATSSFVFGKNSKFGSAAFASLKGKQSVFGSSSSCIFASSASSTSPSVFGSKAESKKGTESTPESNTSIKSSTGFVFGSGSKYSNAFQKSANCTKSIFDSKKSDDIKSNDDNKFNDDSKNNDGTFEAMKPSSFISQHKSDDSSALYQAIKLEKQVVSSGEEEENSVIQMKAKLYVLESIKTGWKERGVGILHVNSKRSSTENSMNKDMVDKDDKVSNPSKARIVMRTLNVLKLVLNVSINKPPTFELFKGMESSLNSEKFIRFNSVEPDKEGKARLVQYAVRVGTVDAAQELYNAIKQFI